MGVDRVEETTEGMKRGRSGGGAREEDIRAGAVDLVFERIGARAKRRFKQEVSTSSQALRGAREEGSSSRDRSGLQALWGSASTGEGSSRRASTSSSSAKGDASIFLPARLGTAHTAFTSQHSCHDLLRATIS